MATYKLTFHFLGGGSASTTTTQQPETIEEFNQKLTATTFQAYLDSSTRATLVNMKNVIWVDIKKI